MKRTPDLLAFDKRVLDRRAREIRRLPASEKPAAISQLLAELKEWLEGAKDDKQRAS